MLVKCPYCERQSEVGDEPAEGQHVRCAYCQQKFSYRRPRAKDKPADLAVGQTVGAYKVVRRIGRGGMGAVYEVEHMTLGAHFAMKVFTAQSDDGDDILRQKFLEEAKQLSAIKHANIAHVFDLAVDAATGAPYFVMDLVTYAGGEPCTLDDLNHAQTEEDLIFLWFSEMCKVLDYVHSLGVIHRDIKLENILLNQDQHVVLTDFGVAKVFEGLMMQAVKGGCKTSGTKDEDLIFGTPHYMAPEVERGEAVTAAADVYSLGVAFLRLLTGAWYDKNPEALKKLSTRKYDWIPVLSEMLAPVDRRPTVLAKFPIKLSQRVTTKFRQAGTWKIVLADKKKKSKLFQEIENARIRREKRELKKQKLKKILIAATIAETALFAGIAYYAYVPHKTPRKATFTEEVDDSFAKEQHLREEYRKLSNKWRAVSAQYREQFAKEIGRAEKEMDYLDDMYEHVDFSDKLSTDAFDSQMKERALAIDKLGQEFEAWKSLYYLSGECERIIDEAKQKLAQSNSPRLTDVLHQAEALRHEGNLHKMQDKYVKAKASYERCIKILSDVQSLQE